MTVFHNFTRQCLQYGTETDIVFSSIILLVARIAVFYFMLIRPEKKRKKEEENLRNSLKVGDRITTIGGIVGKIVEPKDENNIVIETSADRVRMELARFSVMTNNTAKEAAQKARAEAQAAAKAKAEEKKKQKQQEKENKKGL